MFANEVWCIIFSYALNNNNLLEDLSCYYNLCLTDKNFNNLANLHRERLKKASNGGDIKTFTINFPYIKLNYTKNFITNLPVIIREEQTVVKGLKYNNKTGEGFWRAKKGKLSRVWRNGNLIKDQILDPSYPGTLTIDYQKNKIYNYDSSISFNFVKKSSGIVIHGLMKTPKVEGNYVDGLPDNQFIEREGFYYIVKNYEKGLIVNLNIYDNSQNKNNQDTSKMFLIISWKPGEVKTYLNQNKKLNFEGYYQGLFMEDMSHHFNWTKFKVIEDDQETIVSEKTVEHFKMFIIPDKNFILDINNSLVKLERLHSRRFLDASYLSK